MTQSYLNDQIKKFPIPLIERTADGKFVFIHPNRRFEGNTLEEVIDSIHAVIRKAAEGKSVGEIDLIVKNFYKS